MKKLLTIITLTTILLIILTYNERINASTTENWATKEVKIYTCHDDTCNWSNNYTANHTFNGSDLTYPVHAIEWRVKATNGLSIENSYTFSFGYKPTPDSLHPRTYFMRRNAQSSKETITCQTSTDSNGYYMYKCTFTPNEDYTSSEWLYIQIQFYDSYITNLNTKITAFEERQGTNSIITQQTNEIIQQNEQNTQNIINNNNENTQTIINNQNSNTQQQINSQQVCSFITSKNIIQYNCNLNSNGEITYSGNNELGVTDFITIKNAKIIYLQGYTSSVSYFCFYDNRKIKVACYTNNTSYNNTELDIPNNAYYFRATIWKYNNDTPIFNICQDGNQALIDQDHNYNKEDISEIVTEYEEQEQEVETITEIDLTDRLTLNWNTGALNWIWTTFDTIRGAYIKIFALMTSFLALGIIRLVLNR